MTRIARRVAATLLVAVLTTFYYAAASQHARVVNTSKARGDQSGYLWDAQQVYRNWHGRNPPMLIGQRMRMPGYAAVLALFWDPAMSDPEFFERAKTVNIWLSMALLVGFAILFARSLPPLAATNLTLIVAFGYFVFKAGYSQPELLSYFLFFCMFLSSWHLLTSSGGRRSVVLAACTGVLAGLTHLTKAVAPWFLAVLVAALAFKGLRQRAELRRSIAAAALVIATFVAVVYPYIANSKQVFGSYFYNTTTTHYVWYDNGSEGRAQLGPYTDPEGRISVPHDQLPTMRTYLTTRTPREIAVRLGHGFEDMLVRSYTSYAYLKYVVLFVVTSAIVVITNWRAFRRLAQEHAALLLFLGMYAVVFLTSTALLEAMSGTGTARFLIAHIAPLLFVLSRFLTTTPFSESAWRVGSVRLSIAYFHPLASVILAVELAFFLWPRLMSTYGGF